MKLNENMSKLLLSRAGVPVPEGEIVYPENMADFSSAFPYPVVAKAQVLSGGRGKAGGIVKADDPHSLKKALSSIFNLSIKGEVPACVRVEPAVDHEREIYLSCSVSRNTGRYILTTGRQGGVDIESTGQDNLLMLEIDPLLGLRDFHIRQSFFHVQLDRDMFKQWSFLLSRLYQAVEKNHLLLAEINPLVPTDGNLLALDGKVEMDDNFIDLNPALEEYYTPAHYGPEEIKARKAGLSYHKLNGFVGLMVNGAGLAMATMDLLNFSGLPAANFLDLGGGADQSRMEQALSILFEDRDADIIFINIFGGILSCEKVALALSKALKKESLQKPVVVRFSGFKSREALDIIKGLQSDGLYPVKDLTQAITTLRNLTPDRENGLDFEKLEFPALKVKIPESRSTESAALPFTSRTKVLVQGITGREGLLHTREMLNYGTNIVAGVTPFKGGGTAAQLPVYNSVAQACSRHEIDASIIFVPAGFAVDAVLEAAASSIPWVICITEGIPQQDMMRILPALKQSGTRLIGPNTPGVVVPDQCKIGIMPGSIFTPGPVAILSRSGTLTYECVHRLTQKGIGQCFCAGIGGDPFIGQDFNDLADCLLDHESCRALLVLGEIGGKAEEDLGRSLQHKGFDKPVFAFIAGQTAPPGKTLGHAGAILDPASGGIKSKLQAMHNAGMIICPDLASIPDIISSSL
ncbi:MAG: succinate--CoA ligase subunit alpha [Desulfonatronovibrionaceae bacterium]